MKRILVQTAPFDPGAELAALEALDVGAVASFTGLVRADDGVSALTLEHYPGMTEKALAQIVEAAWTRWSLTGVVIIHRVGTLAYGERIVFVGTASAHRHDALDSCAFLIDRLKTDAPFWKREQVGAAQRWVAARDSDDQAAARWQAEPKGG
jgi:molybdopterin synthase catalytic subunit